MTDEPDIVQKCHDRSVETQPSQPSQPLMARSRRPVPLTGGPGRPSDGHEPVPRPTERTERGLGDRLLEGYMSRLLRTRRRL